MPPGSMVAVWKARNVVMLPVAVKFPVVESYSSALAVAPGVMGIDPPAIKTLPLLSRVAVQPDRAVVIFPVGVKIPADGS